MTKYHINPQTGNPGLCKATQHCPFGEAANHYSSKDEAREAYELAQGCSAPETLRRVSKNDQQNVNKHSPVPRKQLNLDALERYEWFHITPTDNLDSIMSSGVQQGDGRHWKGQQQHAIYFTDAAGVFTWMKELRRRGDLKPGSEFAVIGVNLDEAVDLDSLALNRSASMAQTTHGIQMRVGLDELPVEHLEYLGDTDRKPRGWTPPSSPEPRWATNGRRIVRS